MYSFRHFIMVRETKTKPSKEKNTSKLLSTAPKWQLTTNLGEKLKIPNCIVHILLRPYLIMYLNETKKLIILELSVSWEDIILTNERKWEKYQKNVSKMAGR